MIKIKIDKKEITCNKDKSLLQIARENGIEIPSMCFLDGLPEFSSCMICTILDVTNDILIPSCSTKPVHGNKYISVNDEIKNFRKKTLELLLSEHVGECEAPCTLACPANMNIPEMNRFIVRGNFENALKTARKDIALPGVLGRICHAPCEAACRRKPIDKSVSICLLKRSTSDFGNIEVEKTPLKSDKKVAVIGSGPAGLAAAFHIRNRGFNVLVFERNKIAGGTLLNVTNELLPKEILEKEINYIEKSGVEFELNSEINSQNFNKNLQNYDAIVFAVGEESKIFEEIELNGFKENVNKNTFQFKDTKFFIVGSTFRKTKNAIRALAQGKDVAENIEQLLENNKVIDKKKRFNSRFGKLLEEEFSEYLKETSNTEKNILIDKKSGLSKTQAIEEAKKCMHCDCRKIDNCKLRDYSEEYQADQKKYKYGIRTQIRKIDQHELIIFEPTKCIKCGICVRLTEKHKEKYGFTFIGRGFDVEINIPFSESLKKGIEKISNELVDACPTGALGRR